MPEVSVVITYYDSSPYYFRKCLDSIITQTFTDFEAIIVCNANYYRKYWERIKEKYEKIDKRLRFVTIDKKGASEARNYGISLCQGKYLSIVDGDDYVDNMFLSRLVEGMKEGNADLCICGVINRFYPVVDMVLDRRIFFSMPGEFIKVQYMNFSVNKMYKLEIIKENGIKYPEGIVLGEDALFLAQYYRKAKTISSISDGLYHYIEHRTSLTHVFNKKYFDFEKKVIQAQYEMFKEYPLCKNEENVLHHWLFEKLFYTAWYYLEENHKYVKDAEKIFTLKEMGLLLNSNYLENERFSKNQKKLISSWKHKKMSYWLMRKAFK